jgi:hypothetical protein
MYMYGHPPHLNRYTPLNLYLLVVILLVCRWLLGVFSVLYAIFSSVFLKKLSNCLYCQAQHPATSGIRDLYPCSFRLVYPSSFQGCSVLLNPRTSFIFICRFYPCYYCHQTEIIVNMGPYQR